MERSLSALDDVIGYSSTVQLCLHSKCLGKKLPLWSMLYTCIKQKKKNVAEHEKA